MPGPPAIVFQLNSATKWVVVALQTSAIILRRDVVSPFIVIGSIGAAFCTAALKAAINQQRPDGSPLTDPGMPSSHALVSTFAAVSWALYLPRGLLAAVLLLGAAVVSGLRVATGFHTPAQISAGAALGGLGACAWMRLGAALAAFLEPSTAFKLVYSCYAAGTVAFVSKKMATWRARDQKVADALGQAGAGM